MEYQQDETKQTALTTIDKISEVVNGKGAKLVQLATDATRLLSQTSENIETIKNTGFFQRIVGLFRKNSPNKEIQAQAPVIQQTTIVQKAEVSKEEFLALQEFAKTSLEALNERNLLTADALITVKNNLNTLDVKQQEIKEAVIQMAQRVSDRFNKLETRVDNLEVSQSLLLWLDGLEYDDTYKSIPETIRFLKVIKDYYNRKQDGYNREYLLLVKKALASAGIDYKQELSLGSFVDKLVDELQTFDEGRYLQIIKLQLKDNFTVTGEQLNNLLAVPSFAILNSVTESKNKLKDTISLLEKEYNVPYTDALKKSIKNDIVNRNRIDMDVKMTMSDLGIELISCYSAIPDLVEELKPKKCKSCGKEIKLPHLPICPYCGNDWQTGAKKK